MKNRSNRADEQYLDILTELFQNGEMRKTRSGTVFGKFGAQMRFDLADGFPLLTTKKVHFTGIVDELLWFLSGSTNVEDLPKRTQHWWTTWAGPDGDLGPIYGMQYRHARWWYETEPLIFDEPPVERRDGLYCGVGDIGPTASDRGQNTQQLMLKDVWRDMIKRCYDAQSKAFPAYGGKGVHVDPEWLLFDSFARDAVLLPGWDLKRAFPDDYTIDKDVLRASNRYSAATCIWASHSEQSLNTSTGRPFIATPPDGGEPQLFASIGLMQRHFGTNLSAVHRCLQGDLLTHHGWSNFKYAKPADGKVLRFRDVDQLKSLIAGLRFDPKGRRHLINLWNSPAMEHANLPCCHGSIIQFYVTNGGRLSCATYQRSADWFIGVPVNIASYALLTHLVAREVGLEVGELIYDYGDYHLYANHLDQAFEQSTREPRPLPKLLINPDVFKGIFDLDPGDITVAGYDPHPAISAEVAA